MNISQLASSVTQWMSYVSAVGRRFILSEGAIRFPVSEYLGQSNADGIELEYSHPRLFRKRIDLFFKVPPNNKIFFEFKYIKGGSTRTTSEKQRVFNDLMKLYLCLSENQKGYFLICGSQFDFVSSFQTIRTNLQNGNSNYITPRKVKGQQTIITSQGFYTEWFSFDRNIPQKRINLLNPSQEFECVYNNFLSEYKGPFEYTGEETLKLPESIMTNLIFLSEDFKYELSLVNPSKVGVWEIIKTA